MMMKDFSMPRVSAEDNTAGYEDGQEEPQMLRESSLASSHAPFLSTAPLGDSEGNTTDYTMSTMGYSFDESSASALPHEGTTSSQETPRTTPRPPVRSSSLLSASNNVEDIQALGKTPKSRRNQRQRPKTYLPGFDGPPSSSRRSDDDPAAAAHRRPEEEAKAEERLAPQYYNPRMTVASAAGTAASRGGSSSVSVSSVATSSTTSSSQHKKPSHNPALATTTRGIVHQSTNTTTTTTTTTTHTHMANHHHHPSYRAGGAPAGASPAAATAAAAETTRTTTMTSASSYAEAAGEVSPMPPRNGTTISAGSAETHAASNLFSPRGRTTPAATPSPAPANGAGAGAGAGAAGGGGAAPEVHFHFHIHNEGGGASRGGRIVDPGNMGLLGSTELQQIQQVLGGVGNMASLPQQHSSLPPSTTTMPGAGASAGGRSSRPSRGSRPLHDYHAAALPPSATDANNTSLHSYEGSSGIAPRDRFLPAIVARNADISVTGADGGGGSSVGNGSLDYYGQPQSLSTLGGGGSSVGLPGSDVRHAWDGGAGRRAQAAAAMRAAAAGGSGRDLSNVGFADDDDMEEVAGAAAGSGRRVSSTRQSGRSRGGGGGASGSANGSGRGVLGGGGSSNSESKSAVSWWMSRRFVLLVGVVAIVLLTVAIVLQMRQRNAAAAQTAPPDRSNDVENGNGNDNFAVTPEPSSAPLSTTSSPTLGLPPFTTVAPLSSPTLQPVELSPSPISTSQERCRLCAKGFEPTNPAGILQTENGTEVSCGEVSRRIDDRVDTFQLTSITTNPNESCESVQDKAKSVCGCEAVPSTGSPGTSPPGGNGIPMGPPPGTPEEPPSENDNDDNDREACSLCAVAQSSAVTAQAIASFFSQDQYSFVGQTTNGRNITTCADVAEFLEQQHTVGDDICHQVVSDYASFCCTSLGQEILPPPPPPRPECELCPGNGVLKSPDNLMFPVEEEWSSNPETCGSFATRVSEVVFARENPEEMCKKYQTMASTNCDCTVFPHPNATCPLCPDGSRPPDFVLHEPVYKMEGPDGTEKEVTCAELVLIAAMIPSESECDEERMKEWAHVCQCPGYTAGDDRYGTLEQPLPEGVEGPHGN